MQVRIAAALMLALALGACSSMRARQAGCNSDAANARAAGPGCAGAWMDANLRVNDILTIGTHNSYKQTISPNVFALIATSAPNVAPTLDYSHIALDAQLDDGARAIELDVVYDPKGGLFAHPQGPALVGDPLPAGFVEAMSKPGFKVLHVQDVDFRSSCLTLVDCLGILRTWSEAHPRHVPILLTMNAKDDSLPNHRGTQALKFDTAAFDALDEEILSVIPRSEIVTPDDVQGSYPSLRDAVLKHGWPRLGAARGKFIFALDEDEPKISLYRGGRKSLEGRVLFVNAPDTSPLAAYLTLNEALTDTDHITRDAKLGFLIRTRADADTVEARANDTKRREKALTSGAQYVSTDYMEPNERFGPYNVRLRSGAVAECNPVRAAERCDGLPIEEQPSRR